VRAERDKWLEILKLCHTIPYLKKAAKPPAPPALRAVPPQPPAKPNLVLFNVGDQVMGQYLIGQWSLATVISILPNNVYRVQYRDFEGSYKIMGHKLTLATEEQKDPYAAWSTSTRSTRPHVHQISMAWNFELAKEKVLSVAHDTQFPTSQEFIRQGLGGVLTWARKEYGSLTKFSELCGLDPPRRGRSKLPGSRIEWNEEKDQSLQEYFDHINRERYTQKHDQTHKQQEAVTAGKSYNYEPQTPSDAKSKSA